jgi:hypothetical protein
MMQEHQWKLRGEIIINIRESTRELNAGSHIIYFEVLLNSVPKLIFGACLKSVQEN